MRDLDRDTVAVVANHRREVEGELDVIARIPDAPCL
jgi:hypothetical protein